MDLKKIRLGYRHCELSAQHQSTRRLHLWQSLVNPKPVGEIVEVVYSSCRRDVTILANSHCLPYPTCQTITDCLLAITFSTPINNYHFRQSAH